MLTTLAALWRARGAIGIALALALIGGLAARGSYLSAQVKLEKEEKKSLTNALESARAEADALRQHLARAEAAAVAAREAARAAEEAHHVRMEQLDEAAAADAPTAAWLDMPVPDAVRRLLGGGANGADRAAGPACHAPSAVR